MFSFDFWNDCEYGWFSLSLLLLSRSLTDLASSSFCRLSKVKAIFTSVHDSNYLIQEFYALFDSGLFVPLLAEISDFLEEY